MTIKQDMKKELRSWLITWNNYPDLDTVLERIKSKKFRYCIACAETAPTTGTPHVHIALYFTRGRSGNSLVKQFKCNVDCKGKGKWKDELRDYIIKAPGHKKHNEQGEVFFEEGNKPSPGKRTDIAAACIEIENGRKVDDIAIEDPMFYHMYGRTLSKIEDIALRQRFRTEMTVGTWYYGSTGVGKSHDAFTNFTPETHYVYPDDNGWWDGYTGQETVIINDFRGSLTYGFLLNLVDKWPVSVRRRCREPVPFLAKHVIITSSEPPWEVYNNLSANDSLDQLHRRFNIVYCPSRDERISVNSRS